MSEKIKTMIKILPILYNTVNNLFANILTT